MLKRLGLQLETWSLRERYSERRRDTLPDHLGEHGRPDSLYRGERTLVSNDAGVHLLISCQDRLIVNLAAAYPAQKRGMKDRNRTKTETRKATRTIW